MLDTMNSVYELFNLGDSSESLQLIGGPASTIGTGSANPLDGNLKREDDSFLDGEKFVLIHHR